MIDTALFLKLYEIFPEAFNYTRKNDIVEYIPTKWGIEKTITGQHEENLAEDILNTAQAFTHGGNYIENGLNYLDIFKKKSVQNQTIKTFLRH